MKERAFEDHSGAIPDLDRIPRNTEVPAIRGEDAFTSIQGNRAERPPKMASAYPHVNLPSGLWYCCGGGMPAQQENTYGQRQSQCPSSDAVSHVVTVFCS